MTLRTERLELVPTSVDLCDAETEGSAALTRVLGARVPASWPPPVFDDGDVARIRAQLTEDPTAAEWNLHYLVRAPGAGDEQRALVGVAGYGGPPDDKGIVEIGYAVSHEHHRHGYATEAVQRLVERAFDDPRVRVVVATTYASLEASIGVLRKTGFSQVDHDTATGLLRFERRRAEA
jgi:[ribosomal protein S5]-alanine N-acetyltransferase